MWLPLGTSSRSGASRSRARSWRWSRRPRRTSRSGARRSSAKERRPSASAGSSAASSASVEARQGELRAPGGERPEAGEEGGDRRLVERQGGREVGGGRGGERPRGVRLEVGGDRHLVLRQHQVVVAGATVGEDAAPLGVEDQLGRRRHPLGRQPVALDRGGDPHPRFGTAAGAAVGQLDGDEELGVAYRRTVRQLDAAAADHHRPRRARLAAPTDAVGIGGEDGP